MPARSRVCSAPIRVTKPIGTRCRRHPQRRHLIRPDELLHWRTRNESRGHESGDITVDDDTGLANVLESLRTLHGVVGGLVAPDQLAQPHHRHREKMCPTTLSGRFVTAAICVMGMALVFVASTASPRQIASRGKPRASLQCPRRQPRPRWRRQQHRRCRRRDPRQRSVRLILCQAALVDEAPDRRLDSTDAASKRLVADITQHHLPTGLRGDLCDSRPPQPGTDDANGLLKTR